MARKQPPAPPNAGASVAGYFRGVFRENPRLLKERSNAALFRRWLADHPGHETVPDTVKVGLQNVKGLLRRKLKRRGRPTQKERPAQEPLPGAAPAPDSLEPLEVRIDDALAFAKTLDRRGLAEVIRHLRAARNLVVWLGGRP
jgi:hypothetical protein